MSYDIQKRIIAKKPKICIPNIDGFYNSMSGMFNKYDVITIPIIEKSNNNLLIKAKDKSRKGENTNVIYKIQCEKCDATYVGQTKREVSIRVGEQKAGVDIEIKKEIALAKEKEKEKQQAGSHRVFRSYINKKAEPPENTTHNTDNSTQKKGNIPPITQHYINTKHNFKWENYHILDKEPSYHKRSPTEFLYIDTKKKSINLQEDSKGLFKTLTTLVGRILDFTHGSIV